MKAGTGPGFTTCSGAGRSTWCVGALFAISLCAVSVVAQAATVYKCVNAQGAVTFRDTPCIAGATQTKLAPTGQPLIDPGAPRTAPASHRTASHARGRSVSHTTRRRAAKPETSWECHAADGEVFYRHARCPGSIPGDGTVRRTHSTTASGRRTRGRRDAWSNISVHGTRVPRRVACRRIHSAGAAVRDGHLRDDRVSTYDHLMGRDPCSGA